MVAGTDEALALDVETLVSEVARYLEAIDVFRSEGREPRWLPEWIEIAQRTAA